jgi:uncharacterized protein YdeI (YjbR/CyaY-like superfamily)
VAGTSECEEQSRRASLPWQITQADATEPLTAHFDSCHPGSQKKYCSIVGSSKRLETPKTPIERGWAKKTIIIILLLVMHIH